MCACRCLHEGGFSGSGSRKVRVLGAGTRVRGESLMRRRAVRGVDLGGGPRSAIVHRLQLGGAFGLALRQFGIGGGQFALGGVAVDVLALLGAVDQEGRWNSGTWGTVSRSRPSRRSPGRMCHTALKSTGNRPRVR